MRPLALLDLGNVLLDFDFSLFAARVSRLGPLSEREVMEKYARSLLKVAFDTGQIDASTFLGAIRADLPNQMDSSFDIARAWADVFSVTAGAECAVREIAALAEVWILSDTDPVHHRWVSERFPLLRVASRFLASYELGAIKRTGLPFQTVLSECQRDASMLIFIDDRADNVSVARQYGIASFLFSNWEKTLPAVRERLQSIVNRPEFLGGPISGSDACN